MDSKRHSRIFPSDFSLWLATPQDGGHDSLEASSWSAARSVLATEQTRSPYESLEEHARAPEAVERANPVRDGDRELQSVINEETAHNDKRSTHGERESLDPSVHYSFASDGISIRTYHTTRSRLTDGSRDSAASRISEPRTKWQQILHEKNLVLPVFEETNWSGRGQHVEFGPGEGPTIDNLLVPEGVLGHSATALVEKVRCKRIMLARKKIQCNWRLKREDAIEEVAHLQRLSHAHVIRGVGTYVFGKELSILLYPATEYNMETFMDQFSDRTAHFSSIHADFRTYFCMQNAICKFFKCLVNTVSFIHNNLVKHMDIKPTNLLIQEKTHSDEIHYKVYLADFGIARSYNSIADVETESLTLFSRTYAAPEVIRQDKRGFPADIFSLGCVFLEMLAVLEDQRHALIDIRRRNPGGDLSYQANLPALWPLNLLNGKIVGKYDSGFSDQIGGAIKSMLEYHPDLRPTALQLHSIFVDNTGCCSTGPEPFEVAVSLKTDTYIMEALPE